jgi:hypothetical protein
LLHNLLDYHLWLLLPLLRLELLDRLLLGLLLSLLLRLLLSLLLLRLLLCLLLRGNGVVLQQLCERGMRRGNRLLLLNAARLQTLQDHLGCS